ncbi:ASST-domain-containing protein [Elsinoe ampelina]|uniref:ASST-domain-containing protein n=1 Tax=Elsinoe ampelina TaxID=302913 RepID=A0A6A6GPA6_9PEZI|nr:ASST-domain-containing protein [Elsinoe ampelina]
MLNGAASAWDLNNQTSPTHIFRSRPDLHAPIIDMRILRPELVTPGYIFIAPYRNRDAGPYIYDNYGDLVWSGAGESGPKVAHAPHTCQYKGKPHLCFFQGQQHQGFARGHGTIMDQNYQVVKTIQSAGAGASADMHEFRMTPFSNGTSVLMTVYQPRMFDLTINPRFRITGGMGWIVEGVFQEVEIGTGKVLFEWRSTDHIDPGISYTYPGTTDTSGDGLTEDTPWDYFHINSIDKNLDGDYLLSARHTAGLYKISGVDGHLMWQLGGANPTFNQTNFNFSSQHHARWLSENGTHTILSFFDNASNSFNLTNKLSHGYVISINHILGTATAIRSWSAPEGGLSSGSQGNIQILPGGNVHLGWGEHAHFSEHTWEGDPVQYGVLAQRESNVMVYRSYKFNWTGTPLTKPALWTYARSETAEKGMISYVSWNGATEVRGWNFYVSNSSSGPFVHLGSTAKLGFETSFRSDIVYGWSFAEALDATGRALERSEISKTFIPSPSLAAFCDDVTCRRAERVEDDDFDAARANETVVDWEDESPQRGWDTRRYYADFDRGTRREREVHIGSLLLGMGISVGVMIVVLGVLKFMEKGEGGGKGVWEERTARGMRQVTRWVRVGRERVLGLGEGYARLLTKDEGDGQESLPRDERRDSRG